MRSNAESETPEQGWGAWGWGGRNGGAQYYQGQGQPAPQQPVARGFFAPPWSNNWGDRRGGFFWGGQN